MDKTYNLFTLGELKTLLPNVDLNAVLAASGIENAERIMVSDVGALKAAAALYNVCHHGSLQCRRLCTSSLLVLVVPV